MILDYQLLSGTAMEYFGNRVATGESLDFSAQRFNWDITKVLQLFAINGQEIDITQKGVWNPVIDSILGLCYTFDPKTFNNGSIPIKYHADNGQIRPAEMEIVFDVRFFLIILSQNFQMSPIYSYCH